MSDDAERVVREMALRAHDQHTSLIHSTNTSAADAANVAIRALLLVNGGAVVALLAFFGAIEAGANPSTDTTEIIDSLYWFSLGVGLSVVTATLAYLIYLLDNWIAGAVEYVWNYPFVVEKKKIKTLEKIRVVIHITSLATGIGSLVMFFLGIASVRNAITQINV